MHVIRTDSDLEGVSEPALRGLIQQRIRELDDYVEHFSELVSYVIYEKGDDLADLDTALGFSVLVSRFNGQPFDAIGFTPPWEVLMEHAGWYELVYVFSDDGSGVEVFIEKEQGMPPRLMEMCRRYAAVEAGT